MGTQPTPPVPQLCEGLGCFPWSLRECFREWGLLALGLDRALGSQRWGSRVVPQGGNSLARGTSVEKTRGQKRWARGPSLSAGQQEPKSGAIRHGGHVWCWAVEKQQVPVAFHEHRPRSRFVGVGPG